jgi:hypothetical protein
MDSIGSGKRDRLHFWIGFAGFLFSLGLVGLTLYAVFRLLNQFVIFFKSLNPQIATQIVATSGTVLAAVLAVVIGQMITKNREIQEAHRRKKTELYNGFLDEVKKLVKATTTSGEIPDQGLVDFFREFNSTLILWGSPKVIRAYHEWNRLAQSQVESGGSAKAIFAIDDLFMAFRKDLGHSNRGLKKGALIQMYLKPGEFERFSSSEKK